MLAAILNFFLNLDQSLMSLVSIYDNFMYIPLFLIIFIETGTVLAPILPGDSLIFASGMLSGSGFLNIWILFILFTSAAILGDTLNFHIGKFFGPKIFKEGNRFFKKEYLLKTKEFYDRKGGVTIFFARFIPIIRTFAPFVAGMSRMNYNKFLYYNIFGGLTWVIVNLFSGYFLGGIAFVKENFTFVLFIVIVISLIPILVGYLNDKRKNSKPKSL